MYATAARLVSSRSLSVVSNEVRCAIQLSHKSVLPGCRYFRTSSCLDRIIRPRYPDFTPKITPDLKVQDTVIGDGSHETLQDDPDAPSFEMDDPYVETPPKCIICENQIDIDYKNVQLLSQFVSQFTGENDWNFSLELYRLRQLDQVQIDLWKKAAACPLRSCQQFIIKQQFMVRQHWSILLNIQERFTLEKWSVSALFNTTKLSRRSFTRGEWH